MQKFSEENELKPSPGGGILSDVMPLISYLHLAYICIFDEKLQLSYFSV